MRSYSEPRHIKPRKRPNEEAGRHEATQTTLKCNQLPTIFPSIPSNRYIVQETYHCSHRDG